MNVPKLRIARPTRNIDRLKRFYCDGLGYEVIASFGNHEKFDGIMFGISGAPYHLEFTRYQDALPSRPPDPEDLLVFYLPGKEEWEAAVHRMRSAGFTPVASFNPYWEQLGRTFEDPDGHRIVLQNSSWRP
jgi:catechol 2,3-dioxygenase-like lactoylglutathione lyase family enzyme